MPLTNPVSGSTPPPTPSVSTSTSQLTAVTVPVPVTAPVPAPDSTTGAVDNNHNVGKEKSKLEFLLREIYYVEQERTGADTRILKLRDELHALQEIEWITQRVEYLLRLKLGGGRREGSGKKV